MSNSKLVAQYYELTLSARFQNGKWTVVVLGPQGLLLSPDTTYDNQRDAQQAAMGLAQANLQENQDSRPTLIGVDWQAA